MKQIKSFSFRDVSFLLLFTGVIAFALNVKGNYSIDKDAASSIKLAKSFGSLDFSLRLNNPFYYAESNSREVYLSVDLKAKNTERYIRRTPLNISIVIDRSGSMDDRNKLSYVKEAVNYVIDQLEDEDYLSVITYDDEVDVLQPSSIIRGKYIIKDKVSNLRAGGYTNLSGGMLEGYEQVKYSYRRGYVNRVLLLSDGIANKGITDVRTLEDIVQEKNRRDGIVLSTFGVGSDFNEDLMSRIADYGRGNYYYISSPESIARIFEEELQSIKSLAAQNSRIRIRFPSQYLEFDRAFGYPYEVSGNEVIIDFKDVFSSESKSVMLKFRVTTPIRNSVSFTGILEYEDAENDLKFVEQTEYAELRITKNKSEYSSSFDNEVVKSITVFESNELMKQALREADNGNYDLAKQKLQESRGLIRGQDKEIQDSKEVDRQMNNIEKYEVQLESAPSMSTEEKSEMQKENKYDSYKTEKGKE